MQFILKLEVQPMLIIVYSYKSHNINDLILFEQCIWFQFKYFFKKFINI